MEIVLFHLLAVNCEKNECFILNIILMLLCNICHFTDVLQDPLYNKILITHKVKQQMCKEHQIPNIMYPVVCQIELNDMGMS